MWVHGMISYIREKLINLLTSQTPGWGTMSDQSWMWPLFSQLSPTTGFV